MESTDQNDEDADICDDDGDDNNDKFLSKENYYKNRIIRCD